MSEVVKLIDSCAGVAAQRHSRSRVVTARIDELSFLAPVYVGDLVTAKASVNDVGSKSMEIGVRVDAEDILTGKVAHVASAYLVYVAIDDDGKPVETGEPGEIWSRGPDCFIGYTDPMGRPLTVTPESDRAVISGTGGLY